MILLLDFERNSNTVNWWMEGTRFRRGRLCCKSLKYKSWIRFVFGFDPITGRKLEPWVRAVSATGIFGGPLIKGAKHGTRAVKGISNGFKTAENSSGLSKKFVNAVSENLGKAVVKVNSGLKSLGAKVGNINVPVKVNVVSIRTDTGYSVPEIHVETKPIKELVQNNTGKTTKKSGNIHRSEIDGVIKKDYDSDGNLIGKSIVPKGYDSIEDFLKVVDDATIKQFGYDSVDEFKEVVELTEKYLNAKSTNTIRNDT